MYDNQPLISARLKQAHEHSWEVIAGPGSHYTGRERTAIVNTAREALTCEPCAQRKTALSPNHIQTPHDQSSDLPEVSIDAIHRIRTDPGRLTKSWAESVIRDIGQAKYVELISVVASSVIIDTLHNALGIGVPKPHKPKGGAPSHQVNPEAVDAGAWVPILDAPSTMADTGLPQVPNIARSLGLVPSALELFFTTFRPHYALKDIDLSISQGQAEFIAARVSAMNECFY